MPIASTQPTEGQYRQADKKAEVYIDNPEYHHDWDEGGVHFQQFIDAQQYAQRQEETDSVIFRWDPGEVEWLFYKTTTIDGS